MLELDLRGESEHRPILGGDIKQIAVAGPGKKVKIRTELPEKEEQALIQVLVSNVDLFAWGPREMPGINIEVACQRLAIDPEAKSVF